MKKLIFPLGLIIVLSACTSSKQTQNTIDYKELPSSYVNQSSESITKINRKEFLNDTILANLIDSAFIYNNDLQMAFQKIEMAKSGLQFYKGKLNPEININLSSGVRRFGLYTMDGAGNSTTDIIPNKRVPVNLPDIFTGFQANWEVDFRGKLSNQKKAAYTKLLSTEEGIKYIKTNLVTEIATRYYELIALDKELEIIRETITKEKEALEYVKAQKDAGKTNELAVLQFSGQLQNLLMLELEIQQQILSTENGLNILIGRFPQTIHRNKESLYQANTILQKGLPSDLLNHRPDIKAAELNLNAAKLDVKAARAAFLPSFNIVSGIGFQAFNSNYLFKMPESMAFNLLGGLVAPLVNKSAIKANLNLANANEVEALSYYQQKIINGYVEVVNEFAELNNLSTINTIAKKKNEETNLAVDNALSLYKSARVPYLDVIIAQQNALQSNIELINIAKRKKIAALNVYKSIGGGWK
jgi:multidrug efflux system outer membrane protein